MNRNDYWEVIIYNKHSHQYPDMGETHICESESRADILRACADLDEVDVLVNHYVNGEQVYTKYYK